MWVERKREVAQDLGPRTVAQADVLKPDHVSPPSSRAGPQRTTGPESCLIAAIRLADRRNRRLASGRLPEPVEPDSRMCRFPPR